jgi:phage shock protein A
LVLCFLVFGKTAMNKGRKAIKAQGAKAADAALKADPIAVYQLEIDEAAENIAKARAATGSLGGIRERLTRQVDEGKKDLVKIESRINHFLDEGDDERASDYTIQYEEAEARLAQNQDQLTGINEQYEAQLDLIETAQNKIKQAKEESRQLKSDLDMAKANAEISELTSSVGGTFSGDSLDGLNAAKEEIRRQIDDSRGAANVTTALNQEALEDAKVEEEIKRKDAAAKLAEFKAKREAAKGNAEAST